LAMRIPTLPKISIVTPSYNQASFLEETIRSITSQGYPNLEYIVMDGGSTDGSSEIIRKYQEEIAFWQSERDAGQSDALCQGFQRANGEVLAYLNSDDTLEPGTLKIVGEYMASHPEVDLVYGDMNLIDAAGIYLYTAHPLLDLRILVYENPFIPQQAMFWRRALYVRVGGVNPTLRFAMDYDLALKFLLGGARVAKIRKVLANFRVHAAAKSSTIRDVMQSERSEILSRLYPTDEGKLARYFKKVGYRCMRFCREPGSIVAAIRSRACSDW
jgi:glycosyltransferase involved in cell wall biosynthesis